MAKRLFEAIMSSPTIQDPNESAASEFDSPEETKPSISPSQSPIAPAPSVCCSDAPSTASATVSDVTPSSKPRAKKSRWGNNEERVLVPGMPTDISTHLSTDQQRIYVLQLEIEEINSKLRSGDMGISADAGQRSPSPEPVYDAAGKRLNTREQRTKQKLEFRRHELVVEMKRLNPTYKTPSDYKPMQTRVEEKIYLPVDDYPDVNFMGMLIGPRGQSLKTLESETGAKVVIRGKGSVREGRPTTMPDGRPLPGADEPLHVWIASPSAEAVKKAREYVEQVIKATLDDDPNNEFRQKQLRQLALVNGTIKTWEAITAKQQLADLKQYQEIKAEQATILTNQIRCEYCGQVGHLARDCILKRDGIPPPILTQKDTEYDAFHSELSGNPIIVGRTAGASSGAVLPPLPKTSTVLTVPSLAPSITMRPKPPEASTAPAAAPPPAPAPGPGPGPRVGAPAPPPLIAVPPATNGAGTGIGTISGPDYDGDDAAPPPPPPTEAPVPPPPPPPPSFPVRPRVSDPLPARAPYFSEYTPNAPMPMSMPMMPLAAMHHPYYPPAAPAFVAPVYDPYAMASHAHEMPFHAPAGYPAPHPAMYQPYPMMMPPLPPGMPPLPPPPPPPM